MQTPKNSIICLIKSSFLPSQLALIVIVPTSQTLTEGNIVIADSRVAVLLQRLPRRPDLLSCLPLPGCVLHDDLSASLLEEQWTLLHVRVELAVDKDASVDILLGALAEHFVFGHDALVDEVETVEFFAGAVAVLPDFVVHYALVGTGGHELLHEHEVGAATC